MIGALHSAEPIWVNGRPTSAGEIRTGDEANVFGARGVGRARVTRVVKGAGKGTVWLHGASGAQIRCLWDQRVAVNTGGRRRFRRASTIQPGDFIYGLVGGRLCIDPVVAVRSTVESVPAIILELPAVSLLSKEGLLTRPS